MDDTARVVSAEDKQAAALPAHALPAHVQLIQMAMAGWVARMLYAAAKLGLADRLAAAPRNAEELAGPLGADAPSLHRFLRCLRVCTIEFDGAAAAEAADRFAPRSRRRAPESARLFRPKPYRWPRNRPM